MELAEKKWSFYIKFKVSRPLGIDLGSIVFLDKFLIKPESESSLKEAGVLRLESLEPAVYSEICEISKKAEQALILSLAECGIGIAYAESLASEKLLEIVRVHSEKDFVRRHTKIFENHYERPLIHWADKFGVVLFPAESQAWDAKAKQEVDPIDAAEIGNLFKNNYARFGNIFICDDELKKIEIASSILTTSLFSDSLVSKIILSMTAIEVLSKKVMRPESEVQALDRLIEKMSEMEIDEKIRISVEKGLSSIKIQSISKSCKILVKDLLGKKDSELFYKIYDYRSQLVHSGMLKEGKEDMYSIHLQSYSLAKKLLIAYVDDVVKKSGEL